MSPRPDEPRDEAVLVLAPTGRDAVLAAAVLTAHDLRAVTCPDAEALCAELDAGAGAVLLAEEALIPPSAWQLAEVLRRQPPWSDLPVVVFSGGGASSTADRRTLAAIAPLGNVEILERPTRIITLVSTLCAALRARRRQYEVRDLVARLERSVHDRDRFLAMLGHELRNPLAVIALGLQVLDLGAGKDARAQHQIEAIERQGRHLARLVDNLLDVSRVTSGRIHLAVEPVDLVALVEHCAEDAGAAIQASGLELEVVAGPEPVVVQGDAARLEQIVSNLLTNATKYTPEHGRIRVSLARAGDRAVLAVEDTGIGIAKEMLGRILEPFAQVECSLDRARGGLGLGLAVVQNLVDMHHGVLEAASPGLGQGSRFTVTLMISAEPPCRAARPPAGLEEPTVAALRVVVVEDNADIRESLQLLLEASGYHVSVAEDGPSGVATVLAEEPDAALVDIGLPGLSGYEVARAIRSALGPRVFLIAATGYGQPDDQQRAREAGFDAHLTKPVEMERVVALLGEAAKRRVG